MKTYKIQYYIIRGCVRSIEVSALDYKSAKVEFERLTGISKANILRVIKIK